MLLLLTWLTAVVGAQVLPDPNLTPGQADPTKTAEILCAKGYTTKHVRPTSSYTTRLKKYQMEDQGLKGNPGDYEEDHLISLELGGDPINPLNLWPQPWKPEPGAKAKDALENRLHKMVCAGQISLEQAQKEIALNWWQAYQKYVGGKSAKHNR